MSANWKIPAVIITTACAIAIVYTMFNQNKQTETSNETNTSQTIDKPKSKPNNKTLSNNNNISISNPTKNPQQTGISLGITNTNNTNLYALSSASKMNKKTNKIPRGATGIMPGNISTKPSKKAQIIGFKTKEIKQENKTQKIENTDEKDENYDVEVTQPPEYQLKELENIDDSKVHPQMRRDAPTTDMDMEHLTPEMDKQRRRESIILDEDGDEFKQIQQDREERMEIDKLRNKCDDLNDDNEEMLMDDLNALPDLSGLSRLQTDPIEQLQDTDEWDIIEVENVMSKSYKASHSSGVYGSYLINNDVVVDKGVGSDSGMPVTYAPSFSTGVYGIYVVN